ncbi:hypothetical protein BDZ45DRAFT_663038 [Acephala macrosclerotiorum]|nr:hypothetical protein BDZ45DRAFT_663038 [Acephala macrosclerotiorum]
MHLSDEPLTIHITWVFPPEHIAKFFEALHPLKEKLIQEDECLFFNVFEIQGQPRVIRMVEMWDCDMDFMVDVQSKKDYYKGFFATVSRIALEPQRVEVMQSVEGFVFVRPLTPQRGRSR